MTRVRLGALAGVVGFLAFVEFTSGFLQGYYTPMLSDIARHLEVPDADVNWLEGSQLMLSALVVPVLAKLGDMVGHRRILLWSTAVTAVTTLALPFATTFPLFLAAWTLQGVYVVWLPLEIALIWSRTRDREGRSLLTARAAGMLVAALEAGAISGALIGGALIDALPVVVVLLIPGLLVMLCFAVIALGVAESPVQLGGRIDAVGLALVTVALLAFTAGLGLLRVQGAASPAAWAVVVLGLLLFVPFARWELRHPDPLIDVRLFRSPALAPVFATAALFGMSVLGAQAPLSTFIRTDPSTAGYGLGIGGFLTSLVIGAYLIAMVAGALAYPFAARVSTPRNALAIAALLVALGYLLFLPFHTSYAHMVTNMMIAGLGSGALVAALPAAAASGAPPHLTGVATGLTNSTKTVGGAVASAIFGIALMHGVADAAGAGGAAGDVAGGAGSFAGYVVVWCVCGGSALIAAIALRFAVPADAFRDRTSVER
ncbi:MFS transporter [Leucobacter chromiiresistens]|uniref:Major Facilitator Superfamily protein n=2 Tax=Leucobacter chromiiresistens TaxID=1079994 RepID=A0A1H0ZD44_9MICO|nr:MFS transporter [Leucobacter chromiiresistens]SDQ25026.1 Major Facilitator Superfamily protein [Leucobacter chromiiresistens]